MKKTLLTVSTAALLLAGCASNNQNLATKSDIEALKTEIANANATAEKAYQAAQQANLNAQDAKSTAMQTDEKLNRVFRKAQMK